MESLIAVALTSESRAKPTRRVVARTPTRSVGASGEAQIMARACQRLGRLCSLRGVIGFGVLGWTRTMLRVGVSSSSFESFSSSRRKREYGYTLVPTLCVGMPSATLCVDHPARGSRDGAKSLPVR